MIPLSTKVEKKVKLKIHRFDPQSKKHSISTFEVPIRRGMTILDALIYIKDNLDGTLSFRSSCRMGVCGSCAIVVNSQPMLACYTQVLQLDAQLIEVEPLPNLPLINDLVVDIQPFLDPYTKIRQVLIKPEEALREPTEFIQTPKDLKKFWDLSLCIKCSICHSACPAAIDQKFLGPSTYATNYRFMSDSRDEGLEKRLKAIQDNVWLCTSCNSCTMFCPKEVDASSSIVDERSLFVEAGNVPRTVRDVLTSVVKYHNPLGSHPSKRMDWAKDLEIKTFPSVKQANVLCFVGCAAAYDQRGQSIAKSMVSVFNSLGVDYAALGNEEWCCGDHILRLGERGLFEMLAEHNITNIESFDAREVVTLSPHCYNSLKHDEPYSDKISDVTHYSEFLAEIFETENVKLPNPVNRTVTYHDPCFLGKRNEIYDAPRRLLGSVRGLDLVEMKRTRSNSFCCGGGAGRTWTEDASPENRPSVDRVKEALDIKAEIIATACPFCVTTLEDAVKVLDVEDKIIVRDILELLQEAL